MCDGGWRSGGGRWEREALNIPLSRSSEASLSRKRRDLGKADLDAIYFNARTIPSSVLAFFVPYLHFEGGEVRVGGGTEGEVCGGVGGGGRRCCRCEIMIKSRDRGRKIS
jgi:hypothetical protein